MSSIRLHCLNGDRHWAAAFRFVKLIEGIADVKGMVAYSPDEMKNAGNAGSNSNDNELWRVIHETPASLIKVAISS
jgi:hypothetical protein